MVIRPGGSIGKRRRDGHGPMDREREGLVQDGADGVDDSGSVFGRTDFAAIAKGFGLRGTNVTDVAQFRPMFDAYRAQDKAEVWNIHISDKVVSPSTRRGNTRGHGTM